MRRRAILGIWTLPLILFGMSAALLEAQFTHKEMALGSWQMIGEVAPEWRALGWVNSKPLDVTDLRGKVVLLRFFNDNPTGRASLNEFHRTYREQGLTVVGLYTPAPMPTETDLSHLQRLASAFRFEFPVGLDSRWETLSGYWLNRADAELTATTFLIDREGIIRYIQPDGLYDVRKSSSRSLRKEHAKLQKEIEILLKGE